MSSSKIRLGITGASGFIGSHLSGMVRISDKFQLVECHREYFDSPSELKNFAAHCDSIVHLAAVSRHIDGATLYNTNMRLTAALAQAAGELQSPPAICLASTVQIAKTQPYHASKRDSAALLQQQTRPDTGFINMLLPNTFGEYSRPYYNSVVATFCYLAAQHQAPERIDDVEVELIYVADLCAEILKLAAAAYEQRIQDTVTVPARYRIKLPELWQKLELWAQSSLAAVSPNPATEFELNLFHTLRAYMLGSAVDSPQ